MEVLVAFLVAFSIGTIIGVRYKSTIEEYLITDTKYAEYYCVIVKGRAQVWTDEDCAGTYIGDYAIFDKDALFEYALGGIYLCNVVNGKAKIIGHVGDPDNTIDDMINRLDKPKSVSQKSTDPMVVHVVSNPIDYTPKYPKETYITHLRGIYGDLEYEDVGFGVRFRMSDKDDPVVVHYKNMDKTLNSEV